MNKKKIALTILLSALLALSVAFCVLEFSKKPKPIEAPIQPKVEVQAEIPANTGDKLVNKIIIKSKNDIIFLIFIFINLPPFR